MCTVLVVDDDVDMTDVISRVLRARGHKPVAANSRAEALAAAKDRMPEIVVLDLRLQGNDNGLDVLRELQRMGFEGFTIVVSGEAKTTDLSDWRSLNIFVALPKPFELDELVNRLEDATHLHDNMRTTVKTLQEINAYSQRRLASSA